jgi:hypothetical protein
MGRSMSPEVVEVIVTGSDAAWMSQFVILAGNPAYLEWILTETDEPTVTPSR